MSTGIIIVFHGSRTESSGDLVKKIASEVQKRSRYDIVEPAFLQHSTPSLLESIEICLERLADDIIIVPFFLQIGTHVTADIPSIVAKARIRFPDVGISLVGAVGTHPLMVDIVLDLISEKNYLAE